MRRAKTDDNQKQIVEGLRRVGCFVQSLASIGKGCPDLLVGKAGSWLVLEVKDGDKSASRRTLTPVEIDWITSVRNRAPVHVVETLEDALRVVGIGGGAA